MDKINGEQGKKLAGELKKHRPKSIAHAVVYALDQPSNFTVDDIVIHLTAEKWWYQAGFLSPGFLLAEVRSIHCYIEGISSNNFPVR